MTFEGHHDRNDFGHNLTKFSDCKVEHYGKELRGCVRTVIKEIAYIGHVSAKRVIEVAQV